MSDKLKIKFTTHPRPRPRPRPRRLLKLAPSKNFPKCFPMNRAAAGKGEKRERESLGTHNKAPRIGQPKLRTPPAYDDARNFGHPWKLGAKWQVKLKHS